MGKPKSLVSTAFIGRVNEIVQGAFGVGEKRHRVREHVSLEFALSATIQIMERGSIYDSTLDALPKHMGEHRKTQLLNFQMGTKGLTVHDDGNGTVVHLLQVQGRVDEMHGTYIHEVMHVYSNDDFKEQYGKDLDEGVTEFFAQEIMKKVDPDLLGRRGRVYQHERGLAEILVDAFGRKELVGAYFRGDTRIMDLVKAALGPSN